VFGFDDRRMLMAAVLHDTIEDTTTDFDDLAEAFGKDVAAWVGYLSKDKRLVDDQRERAYIEGLRSAPWQVHVCKLADIYDNLLDSAGLSPERRRRTASRSQMYLEALAGGKAPEMAKPVALVRQLLERVRLD
jgi:guanosine-3',5'-bis(diphosphate) 3'-pyrophosphohydrolase